MRTSILNKEIKTRQVRMTRFGMKVALLYYDILFCASAALRNFEFVFLLLLMKLFISGTRNERGERTKNLYYSTCE